MSSLSAALNSSALDIDDVAFWDRVAAHFREKLGRMVCRRLTYPYRCRYLMRCNL